jgi:DNA polymerase III delta prime subunit
MSDAILLAGPTTSGKSALALALAEALGGTIINADSMQVYRDLRIITARPEPADETRVPHLLYGHVDAAENYSVGRWCVDKWYKGERLRNRLETADEAKAWLVSRLDQLRRVKVWGERRRFLFDQAAARYIGEQGQLVSIEDTAQLLAGVMPYIGHLFLDQVYDDTLQPFVEARLKAGRAPKTVNLALSAVRRVLNLAARRWRDR